MSTVIDAASRAWANAPQLRVPGVAVQCLLRARTAQITLGVLLLFLVFAFPPLRDAVLGAVFPEQTVTRKDPLLGLVPARRKQAHPWLARSRGVATVLVWLGSGLCVAVLFGLHIPVEVARLERVSRRRDEPASAETIVDSDELPASPSAIEIKAPSTGRFHLVEELGRGGMGRVYRARDEVLGRDVAIKELSPGLANDPQIVARFRQEARALAKLRHPNIIQIHDLIDDTDGRLCIVMELIEGGNLADRMREGEPIEVAEAIRLAGEVARGLTYAHSRGVVHRDLKPLNVLMTTEGSVKISDFGLAKLAETTLHTMEGSVLGSPRYMSPEQADGRRADEKSDVYSFGVILYELLAGRPPFEGNTASVLVQHLTKTPPPFRDRLELEGELEAFVFSMLAKSADDRPSARETEKMLAG